MNKKSLFAIIILIGCVILLFGSYLRWNQKISSAGTTEPAALSTSKSDDSQEKKKKSAGKKQNGDVEQEPNGDLERLLSLAANTDPAVQALFEQRLTADKTLNVLLTGSTVMDRGNPGYAEQLKDALEKAYGDAIQVTTEAFDMTTDSFIDSFSSTFDGKEAFDLVILEPFNLKNNGLLSTDDQVVYLERFKQKLTDAVADSVLVLHPSQPLYNAIYYPQEVDVIQEFAKANDIPYIDHWTAWPAGDSDDLQNFLDDDNAPNQDGIDVWANTLIDYFIVK